MTSYLMYFNSDSFYIQTFQDLYLSAVKEINGAIPKSFQDSQLGYGGWLDLRSIS